MTTVSVTTTQRGWVRVGALADFTDQAATTVALPELGRVLALVRFGGEVYVLDDRCSHEDFSLSAGNVDADDFTIECEHHGALFDVRDGSALSLPATKPVACVEARVREHDVEVLIP